MSVITDRQLHKHVTSGRKAFTPEREIKCVDQRSIRYYFCLVNRQENYMAIGVKIDFTSVYEVENLSEDLRLLAFKTHLTDGRYVELKVEISNETHELMPNVYNLAFGPLNLRGKIDDKIELPHQNHSKVFSTILLGALNYLAVNPAHYVGIDGSDNFRAYYYWRFLQRNHTYLAQFFEIFGIKYYVRITRFGKQQYQNPFDFGDLLAEPDRITKTDDWPEHLYNYFIFKVKR